MKQSELYNATHKRWDFHNCREMFTPSITALRASLILEAAKEKADMSKPCKINKVITNQRALEIFTRAIDKLDKKDIVEPLTARNIVRCFGALLEAKKCPDCGEMLHFVEYQQQHLCVARKSA